MRGPLFWALVAGLALLGLAGGGALAFLAAAGPEPRARWGYAAATLGFLLSTFQAAPLLAFASRLAQGAWGIPLRRLADLGALAGLVTTPLFLVVAAQLPAWQGRPSIWLDWPGAPALWDGVAVVLLAVAGLALVYVASLPDLAGRRLALGWTGTARRWRALSLGVLVLGTLYTLLYVLVHLLVASDLALSLVPGWHSALFLAYHALSGFQAGVAATVLALAALRRLGHPVEAAPFRACAKLLLALSLLWFYFVWSEFLTYWYGSTPTEERLLALLMFGPSFILFTLAAALSFGLPFLLLVWNPVRNSAAGATLAAALIVVGTLLDRIRVYVAAWSVAGPVRHGPEALPPVTPLPLPTALDLLVVLGLPAATLALILLALRLVPPISAWETAWGQLLTLERPYLKTRVHVFARPS